MAEFIKVSVINDKQVEKALKKLELKMQKKLVGDSMKRASRFVRRKAKQSAPVLSGRLRNSFVIRKRQSRSKRNPHIKSMVITKPRAYFGISSTATGFYPAIQEFGSKTLGIKPSKYLRDSLYDNDKIIIGLFRKDLRRKLLGAAKR